MKRLLEFLSLGVIIGPFPNQIVNAQPIDAIPVMADLNWIQAQVNANAAPAGSAGEWTATGVAATFISGTQFSVPGNLLSIFSIKRRILLTVAAVNGGATVTAATFGAGITTVTCLTDTAGFLAAGLTDVAYSIQDSVILAAPRKTNIHVFGSGGGVVVTNTSYILGSGAPWASTITDNDIFNEYVTGTFTIQQSSNYLINAQVCYAQAGAAFSTVGTLQAYVNGAPVNQPASNYSLGVTGTLLVGVLNGVFTLTAGSLLTIRTIISFAAPGPTSSFFNISVSQLF